MSPMPRRVMRLFTARAAPTGGCLALPLGSFPGPAAALVGDPHQQGEDHVVGHQRRPAEGDERQRHPGEGQHPDDPADDQEGLHAEQRGEPGGQQLLEGRLGPQGDAQPAADQQQEGGEHGGSAQQAQLLADDGEDEVGLPGRDALRLAQPGPGAGDAPVGQGEGRLHHLEAGALGRRPRVEPDGHPVADVAEELVGDRGAHGEQHDADGQVRRPFGGHPDQHHEQGEEQQRGAQVLLGHHDQHRDAPGERAAGPGAWDRAASPVRCAAT